MASNGQRPRILPNTLQFRGQFLTTVNHPTQNICSAEADATSPHDLLSAVILF